MSSSLDEEVRKYVIAMPDEKKSKVYKNLILSMTNPEGCKRQWYEDWKRQWYEDWKRQWYEDWTRSMYEDWKEEHT